MAVDILVKTFYGNTISEWFMALLIIFASVLVGKTLYWVFKNIAHKLTKNTKTKLDDIIMDMIEEPIVVVMILLGFWFAFQTLNLTPGASVWIGNVFQILIVLNVAWLITRLIDSLIKEYLIPLTDKTETDLDDTLIPIVRKGIKMVIWVLAIIIALNNAGYDVSALIAGLGIGGLAFAMAAKDLVANIFGGFTIFTDKPFRLNDRIKIKGFDGTVNEIGIRSTRITTLEGRNLIIPNSVFSSSPIENVSSEPSRKIVLNLGLTYDTNPEDMSKAMEILKDISSKIDGIEDNVKLSFNAFGDSAMNILFIYYIKKGADILGIQTQVNLNILTEFNKNKLEFAYPTQTIFTKK